MTTGKPQINFKALFLLCVIAAVICAYFWLGSRYPALNLKAMMSDQTAFSGIGFDVIAAVSNDQHFIHRVLNTTLNWLYSNLTGMSFGLLIAPVILCIFKLFSHVSPRNGLHASLLGAFIGAPLGVCANCATPIAYGIGAAKGRLETVLAIIISSPTLNIIAITMMLAVLPSYVVAIKLILTIATILIAIPLLVRLFPAIKQLPDTTFEPPPLFQLASAEAAAKQGWGGSAHWVVRNLTHSFIHVAAIALPFMILAGLLGSLLITLLPADTITQIEPQGYALKTALLSLVSVLATLLPVPMTFDVILATNLHLLGTDIRYVAAILFGLGTFSIYPYLILWRFFSPALANATLIVIIATSFAAGVLSHYAAPIFTQWQNHQLQRQVLENARPLSEIKHNPEHRAFANTGFTAKPYLFSEIHSTPDVVISAAPFSTSPTKPNNSQQFSQVLGDDIGIETAYTISLENIRDLGYFQAIASGDVNQDNWPDILIADALGPRLFLNNGSGGFIETSLNISPQTNSKTTVAALVDTDGDYFLDIVYANSHDGIYILKNNNGSFTTEPIKLPETNSAHTVAHLSFSDLDNDADLDIVVGNWSIGSFSKEGNLNTSRNAILWNDDGAYVAETLSCTAGETLTTLSSDLDGNGWPELIVGNDFTPPDCFYKNMRGQIQLSSANHFGIAETPIHTMSYDSGDINNDGRLDIFASDMSDPIEALSYDIRENKPCNSYQGSVHYEKCLSYVQLRLATSQKPDSLSCIPLRSTPYFYDCNSFVYFDQLMTKGESCTGVPDAWPGLKLICVDSKATNTGHIEIASLNNFNSRRGNTLLLQQSNGEFSNQEEAWGVKHSGWNWNARFTDFDHDTWQDLYMVNGFFNLAYSESNVLFTNEAGQSFSDATVISGLEDYQTTTAFTVVDVDNDGDQDLITRSPFGPAKLLINQANGNALKVSLRDNAKNTFAIGSLVTIHYGGGQQQIRELKLSGGFTSYDAPYVHFGLNDYKHIDKIEIDWPDGTKTLLNHELSANQHIEITRK